MITRKLKNSTMTNEEKLDRLLAIFESNTVIVMPRATENKTLGSGLTIQDYAAICIRNKAKGGKKN